MSKNRSLILLSMVLPLLAAAALLGAFTAMAAPNATITVTNRFDSGDGSLRQAIIDANPGDIINFTTSLTGQSIPLVTELTIDKSLTISGSVPITISGRNATRVFNVTAGNVTFDSLTIRNGNVQTNDCGTTSDQCGGGIMIQNSGVAVTITNSTLISNTADDDGGGIYNNYGTLKVTNSTLISNTNNYAGSGIYNNYGTLMVTDSTLSVNAAGSEGGGIYSDYTLTVSDSTLCGNSATDGGGIYNDSDSTLTVTNSTLISNTAYSYGGGIYNDSDSTLTVTSSTLSGNSADDDGGGIYNNQGTLTVANSTLSGNSADDGGGIHNYYGTLTVTNSTLSGNAANNAYGGGINEYLGTVTVNNSTLSGNSAYHSGGGIYLKYGSLTVNNSTLSGNTTRWFNGGGIYQKYGSLTINNSTIFANRTDSYDDGSGIYSSDGTLTVANSTFSRNYSGGEDSGGIYHTTGTFHLRNTILANSTYYDCVSTNVLSTDINNLIEVNNGCGTPVSNDDPVLGPLQDNGGDTRTLALLPGSPAIDAGDNPSCLAADQRGIARPQNTSCDIGALESHGFTLSLSGGTPQTTDINTTFAAPLALTVTSPGSEPVEGGEVTFAAPDSGAGLTFSEAVATVGSGGAISLTVTANDTVGTYQVTAFANGNSGSAVTYILTNEPVYMLTVQLDGNGSGSVSSTPAGIDCGGDCSKMYSDGTEVTLIASADTGSTFTGWGGACSGISACEVTMDAAKSVTAIFTLDTHELTVSRAGTGSGSVSSTPAGIVCGTYCSETYDYGTVVTLTATADTGFIFTGWDGACSGTANCVVTMYEEKSVTATFMVTRELTVSRAGIGYGSISSTPAGIDCGTDCSEMYSDGTVVTLTSTAYLGSTFIGWGDACSGTAACVVTMDAEKNVTATFTKVTHDLTVSLAGTGSGSVSSTPAGIVCGTDCSETYDYVTVVTLIATADTGSTFTGWGGACSGTAACVVIMYEAKSVTATFMVTYDVFFPVIMK